MTDKDDPSRVALGGNGNGGRYPRNNDHSGNGVDGNGTAADQAGAFPNQPIDLGQLAQLAWRILDHLDRGIIALAVDGKVIDANRHAKHVLEAGDSMRVRAGRLEFQDPSLKDRLTRLLSALALGAVVATGFVARLHASNGSRSRRILVSPVSSQMAAPADIAVLVDIFDTHSDRVISLEVLHDLYGLTSAQAEVAARLFEGYSVEGTANVLGLSINTVRSHLKHVFTKCEVQSQVELMHLLDLGPHSL